MGRSDALFLVLPTWKARSVGDCLRPSTGTPADAPACSIRPAEGSTPHYVEIVSTLDNPAICVVELADAFWVRRGMPLCLQARWLCRASAHIPTCPSQLLASNQLHIQGFGVGCSTPMLTSGPTTRTDTVPSG